MNDFYHKYKNIIQQRLAEFKQVKGERLFYELCFCILTPQSKARKAHICQTYLQENNFLHEDIDILTILRKNIRFHNVKEKRLQLIKESWPIIKKQLGSTDSINLRKWLVDNINGLGLKEASHYLRNIGRENLAILDRHILRKLVEHEVINELPKSLPEKKYLEIEQKFQAFSRTVNISMDELDLLFWAEFAGEVFK